MQTRLAPALLATPEGAEADAILRKCVHCGFCTATCPTYQLLGDELDGPRGRIYLIKEMLEGAPAAAATQLHLDRCLTCRACESACPSGVSYARLLEIGRRHLESTVPRTLPARAARQALLALVPHRARFSALLALGRVLRPLLPPSWRRRVPMPSRGPPPGWPPARHARRMLVLEGCVQSAVAPGIDAAAARVLDRLGISLVGAGAGCCGALAHHLSAERQGREQMRRNIDAWWPQIERGAEAIVVSASGCGAMVRDYGRLLAHDGAYALKAARVSALFRDLSQIIAGELGRPGAQLPWRAPREGLRRLAFHSPCTLQHALGIRGAVESLLALAGFTLTPVADGHLCCGSAGSYSLLQPGISGELRRNRLAALEAAAPDAIVTANIGCQLQLSAGTARPVRHWIEVLAESLPG
jgi:glycolate oxidase iron-sulfur subunit